MSKPPALHVQRTIKRNKQSAREKELEHLSVKNYLRWEKLKTWAVTHFQSGCATPVECLLAKMMELEG